MNTIKQKIPMLKHVKSLKYESIQYTIHNFTFLNLNLVLINIAHQHTDHNDEITTTTASIKKNKKSYLSSNFGLSSLIGTGFCFLI